jgi:uncharacterized protein (DUF2126 family)
MYLIPGDSPMGYRLPLDALPWIDKRERPFFVEHDPFAPRGPLPLHADIRAEYAPHAVGGGFAEGGAVGLQAGFEPPDDARAAASSARGAAASTSPPGRPAPDGAIPRTALCVEVRDPRRASGPAGERAGEASRLLYVFMPPLAALEDYLELVSAIEATAAELGLPVVLEGYPPPRDPRLRMLQITPDPGVIEVNIHPAAN